MAKVSLENLPEEAVNNTNNGNNPQVSFFNIKDGEEATVRILIDSFEDFDIHTVHNVPMEGFQYGRRMNCLRQPSDPIELCPLCAAGKSLDQRIYLHLIQYEVSGDKIVGKAKVWERSIRDRNFGVNALKGFLASYGPLSEMVCKIVRRGSGLNTEYQFMPALNPSVYRPDLYVKDTSAFENWSPLGIAVLNKTAEEYNTFLATGNFPQAQQNPNAKATPRTYNSNTTAPVNNNPIVANTSVYPTQPAYVPPSTTYVPGVTPISTPETGTAPVEVPGNPTYQPPVNPAPTTPPQTFGASDPNAAFTGTTPRTMPWNNVPNNAEGTGGFERPRRY